MKIFSFVSFAAKTHWLLSDVMNHCQEFHPELENGPAAQLGSANHFRWTLGSGLCPFPDLTRSLLLNGSWIVKDEATGRAMVAFYPRSEVVPTEEEPGIMMLNLPELEAEAAGGPVDT
jgi:hypothetical protein